MILSTQHPSDLDASSTHSVGMGIKLIKADAPPTRIRPRRVTFGKPEFFARSPKCETASISSTWYSSQDYACFKAIFLEDVKETARENRSSNGKSAPGKCVSKAFEKCCTVGYVDPVLTLQVAEYLQSDASRAGLERAVAKKVFQDKKHRRSNLYETLYNWQLCGNTDPETLKRASESLSRPSRTFARVLAEASSCDIVPASSDDKKMNRRRSSAALAA